MVATEADESEIKVARPALRETIAREFWMPLTQRNAKNGVTASVVGRNTIVAALIPLLQKNQWRRVRAECVKLTAES
jgi:hypothetical protein